MKKKKESKHMISMSSGFTGDISRKLRSYNMNILYADRIVGRLDPKAHRDKGKIEVKSLHLEEDFKPDREFKEKLEDAFKSFMKFHKAEKMTFTKAVPEKLGMNDLGC